MENKQNKYIGIMTGTSLDAVEVALIAFDTDEAGNERGAAQFLRHGQFDYPQTLRETVLAINQGQPFTMQEYGYVDIGVARACSHAVEQFLDSAGCQAQDIVAIGLHGQTVHHQPDGQNHDGVRFTLQLGDPHILATHFNIPVVADFRRRDMALGGQGAPLACAFHDALFRHPQRLRMVLNLGGIANVTVLAPGQEVFGFDTGPANILLDAWVQQHLGCPYDKGGQWARTGRVIPELLERFLADPFFALAPPKSTGREHFNAAWLDQHLRAYQNSCLQDAHSETASFERSGLAPSIQATLLELTARTVAQALQQCSADATFDCDLVVCGGGAYNHFLLERLAELCPRAVVQSSEAYGMMPEAIEAAAFAFFARETWWGRCANIPSVTGASRPCLLGNIILP